MTTKEALALTLKAIGEHGFDGTVLKANTADEAIATLLKTRVLPLQTRRSVIREARRQKLIDMRAAPDGYKLTITPAGAVRLQRLAVDAIRIKKPAHWDGVWRLVTFDIPVQQSAQRVQLIRQLRRLGFVLLQRSMWVYPYPCIQAVEQVADYLNLKRYCTYMEVSRFDAPTARKLQQIFDSSFK